MNFNKHIYYMWMGLKMLSEWQSMLFAKKMCWSWCNDGKRATNILVNQCAGATRVRDRWMKPSKVKPTVYRELERSGLHMILWGKYQTIASWNSFRIFPENICKECHNLYLIKFRQKISPFCCLLIWPEIERWITLSDVASALINKDSQERNSITEWSPHKVPGKGLMPWKDYIKQLFIKKSTKSKHWQHWWVAS